MLENTTQCNRVESEIMYICIHLSRYHFIFPCSHIYLTYFFSLDLSLSSDRHFEIFFHNKSFVRWVLEIFRHFLYILVTCHFFLWTSVHTHSTDSNQLKHDDFPEQWEKCAFYKEVFHKICKR